MVSFDDPLTELTGVGRRISERTYDARYDVTTVGELFDETRWRTLHGKVSSQYHDAVRRDLIEAELTGQPSATETPAEARLSQWEFVMRATDHDGAIRRNHAVVGNWQRAPSLPEPQLLDGEARAVVPTHHTAQLSGASRGPTYTSDGTIKSHGIAPVFYVGAERPTGSQVSAEALDGNTSYADTVIPARSVGLLSTLFDTTPPTLLDDARFMPNGPLACTDNATGLDVLIGPFPRPNDQPNSFGALPLATQPLAEWL